MANMVDLAQEARSLVSGSRWGLLGTLRDEDGYPYTSLIELMPLDDGDIVLLLSRLAEHRKALEADSRASVLVGAALEAAGDLTQPRVSLLGLIAQVEDPQEFAQAYTELHPEAAAYLQLGDFHFFRLQVERARYIAGFGRMGWIEAALYRGL